MKRRCKATHARDDLQKSFQCRRPAGHEGWHLSDPLYPPTETSTFLTWKDDDDHSRPV